MMGLGAPAGATRAELRRRSPNLGVAQLGMEWAIPAAHHAAA